MSTLNRYSPPATDVVAPTLPATPAPAGNWFSRRPIPVYIIATFCVLQFIGVSMAVADAWGQLFALMNTGAMSPAAFIGKLLYPALLFAAGVTLLLLRRVSVVFFGIYLAWGVAKIVAAPTVFMSYLSLSLVSGAVVYCVRLAKNGLLR
jgi:hypothetical protein